MAPNLKSYLDATSIHGMRYLTTSQTHLERLVWGLVLMSAFGYLSFLSWTSFNEAAKNPLIASIDVMERSKVTYPVVTVVKPLHGTTNFRYPANVLNVLEFDCTKKDLVCMDRTRKLREDFRPMVEAMVIAVHTIFDNPNDTRRRDVISDFPTGLQSSNKVTKMFCKFKNILSQNSQDLSKREERSLILFMANNFRAPGWLFLRMLQTEISKIFALRNVSEIDMAVATKGPDYPCNISDLSASPVGPLWNTYLLLTDPEPEFALGDLFDFILQPYVSNELTKHVKMEWPLKAGKSLIYNLLMGFNLGLKDFNVQDVFGYFISGTCTMILPDLFNQLSDGEAKLHQCHTNDNLETFSKHVDGLYHVFNYLLQPVSLKLHGDKLLHDIESAINNTGYSAKPRSEWRNLDPALIDCHFGKGARRAPQKGNDRKCSIFKRSYFYGGIGYTFNSAPFFDTFSRSLTNKAFYNNVYLQDIDNEQSIGPAKASKILDFTISMDAGFWYKGGTVMSGIVIHGPSDITSTRSITLHSGNRYWITITPSLVTTDEDTEGIPAEKRGCRFQHETSCNGTSTFATYKEHNCLMDCQDVPDRCRMWTVPQRDPTSFCPHDKFTFWGAGDSRDSETPCDCPPDCNLATYQLEVESAPLHIEGQTDDNPMDCQHTSRLHWRSHIFEFLSSKGPDWQTSADNGCRLAKKTTTRVTVFVDSSSVRRVHRRKRLSFADQLAILGGLLGLFTGMSIISVIEAGMWIGRAAIARVLNLSGMVNQSTKKIKMVKVAKIQAERSQDLGEKQNFVHGRAIKQRSDIDKNDVVAMAGVRK